MRDLIRKILKEEDERLKRNEILVDKKTPSIIRYMDETYGDSLRFKIENKNVLHVSEKGPRSCKILKVYVEDESLLPSDVKAGILLDLKTIFGIDVRKYGACFSVSVYKKWWEEI